MYIWRKRATTDWVRNQSEGLESQFGSALAITEQPGKARTSVDVSCEKRSDAVRLQRAFGGTIEKLRNDWLKAFTTQTRAKPIRVGSRLIVSRTNDGPRTIAIPAEAAFGTGEHATTALCLRMLERITRPRRNSWSLLDAGTGSGILAIAGARLGAKRVVAIENDPMACAVAKRNAKANGVHNIEFRAGDVIKQRFGGRFDIITANLYSEVLIAALPGWSRLLATDGSLILSGILHSQEPSIVAALRRHTFAVQEARRRGKWVALLVRKNS